MGVGHNHDLRSKPAPSQSIVVVGRTLLKISLLVEGLDSRLQMPGTRFLITAVGDVLSSCGSVLYPRLRMRMNQYVCV